MESSNLLVDLFRAYYSARKNKRNTINALKFELEYEKNLFALYEEIKNRTYTIGPSTCFVVNKPVKREIFAADFRDRIVHHLIFNYINPIFEKHFIKDSYSCRIGKGTSYGIERIDHFIRSCSENYRKDCFVLKLDISGYFMSMDRDILYAKIEERLKKISVLKKNFQKFDVDLVLYLVKTVVSNDPTQNCRVKGKREDWIGMPKSKSLFCVKEGKGFPIGNLTSQLFGNIYLDEFDHFVQEKIGVKQYGRYVDDIVFVHCDKEFLKTVISKVNDYLRKELTLTLHPKKIHLQEAHHGVSFLGTFIKPRRIYIGKRVKGNFYGKIRKWNEYIVEKNNLNGKEIEDFVACMNSYLGMMKQYDSYTLRRKMLDENVSEELWQYVGNDETYEKVVYLHLVFGFLSIVPIIPCC